MGSATPNVIVLEARVAADAAPGVRSIKVGEISSSDAIVVYDKVGSLRVEPENAIARVGGNGGPLPPVPAQFDAVAYLDGADGVAGTEDDVRIGVVPAAWSVSNANEVAAALEDKKFAGTMDPASGLFTPAAAGPNPERPFSTNNAGDLTVVARFKDGERVVEGSAHLVVTVQRWNDPPIR